MSSSARIHYRLYLLIIAYILRWQTVTGKSISGEGTRYLIPKVLASLFKRTFGAEYSVITRNHRNPIGKLYLFMINSTRNSAPDVPRVSDRMTKLSCTSLFIARRFQAWKFTRMGELLRGLTTVIFISGPGLLFYFRYYMNNKIGLERRRLSWSVNKER